jgi:DNA-binding LytR/AlgR family response regulator
MCSYYIIERDIKTIKAIKDIMADFEGFHCLGTSSCSENAMNMVLKEMPELVFLNIDKTIENPYQFVMDATMLCSDSIEFIALSSHKKKAYDAIKLGICDFLLCPIKDLDIRKTLLNFQKKKLVKNRKRLCLKSHKDYQYIYTEDILFLKADNNSTEFHMKDGRVVNSYKTLKTFEKLLPKEFLRIHKSYIINKNFVTRVQFGKSICSVKKNNFRIPFSESYLDVIKSMNNNLSQLALSPSLN